MDGDSDNERGSLLPRNSVDKEVSKECVDMRLKYVSSSEDDTDNIDWATDDEEANMPLVSKSHSAQDSSIDDNSHSAACCIDIEDNIELTQNMPKDNFSNETLKRSKVINNNSTLECTSSVAINVIQESGVMINDKKLEESCNDKLCVQIAEPNIDTEENPKGQDNQCTIVKPIIKTKSISHFPGTSTDTTMQYLGNISSSLKCRSMNDIHLDQDNCGRDSNQPKETEFPLQPSNSENTRQIDTVDEVVRVDSKYGSYEEEENKCGHDIQCVVVKPIVKTISISHFPGTSGDTSMKYLIANKQTPLKCRSMNDIPLEQGQCGTDSTQGDKQPELKLQCRNSANTGQIENQCDLSEDYTVKIDDVVRIGSTAENQNTEENNQSVIVKPIIKTISVSHFPGTTADTSMKYLMANDLTSLRCRSMNDIPSIQGQCGTDSTESNRQTEMQTINSGIMGEIEYNCDWPHQFTVKLDKVGRSESTDTEENKNGPDNQYVPINKTISYSHFPGTPTDTTMNYLIGNNPIYVKCRSMNDIPSSTTSNKCYKETKDTLQTTNTAIAGQVEDQCNLPEKYTEKLDVVGRADSLAESEGDFILIGKNLKANLFSKSENEISKLAKDISDIAVPKKLVAKSDNALVKHLESPTDLYMITNESTESDQQEFVNKTGNASSLVTLKSIQCSKDEDEEEMNTNQGPDEQMKPASNAVELQAQQSVKDLLENTNAVQKTIGLERMGSVSSLNKAYEKPYLQDLESDYLEKIDNSFQTDGSSEQNHLMYDQNISESLRNQLNRFDILIETMDQRNSRNIATNAAERGYWSTIFGQASENEAYDDIIPDIKAHRALELLEDYHSRLSEPQDRALRMAIERVIRIFKSRLFQALLARDFMQAYKHQSVCIQSVVKMLQQLKEENWCLPVMYTACLDLRILAQRCEELGNSTKPGEILEKAADCLMSCFRVCAADNRSSDNETKRLGMLHLVNQLFKVYFRINKLHLCKPLIRAIDSSAFKDMFPLPERITYKYFVGRKAMFDSDYKSADEFLSFAFKHCPKNFPRNKRLILIYLVPVKMLLGFLPKKYILERYDVLQFHELAEALKEGNVRKFDDVIQRHEIFFIKCGIYLLVEKLKFIVYRNLFKKVYLIKQTHQLDLNAFRSALQFVGETDMTIDETHCIVANLIFEGKIKGYISHSHNKLVVSKQNPFPPLNTVS